MSKNNCTDCDHKKHPGGGHCYMFRVEPGFTCMQHTSRKRKVIVLGNTSAVLTGVIAGLLAAQAGKGIEDVSGENRHGL